MKYTETFTWQEHAKNQGFESNYEKYIETKKNFDEAEEKIKSAFEILRKTGFSDTEKDLVLHCLRTEHRTHQQAIIRSLYGILKEYGKFDTDARNEEAVKWASAATHEDVYFPFI